VEGEGITWIADALRVNKTLKHLDVGREASIHSFASFLSFRFFLLTDVLLLFKDNNIGNEGGKALLESLKVNQTLLNLELECETGSKFLSCADSFFFLSFQITM
jgi:hypothetical protein